jgi:predicted phage baseplate assembly protein
MGDTLSFYGDRIANEAFLETAVLRSSVLKIAAMLDYRPTGTLAASTMLQFTLAPGTGTTLIPANTKLSTVPIEGEEPLVFETLENLTILGTGATPASYIGTVGARQGKTYSDELLGNSTGGVDQEFPLFYSPVIESSVQVFVNEAVTPTEWVYFSQLIDAGPSDNAFTTTSDENNIERIRFGDNVNGRTPPIGSVVTATYRVGGGSRGNVGAGTVTQFIDVIGTVIAVTNSSQAQGGANAETIDEIRQNAPRSLTTVDRAVTLDDYAAVAIKHIGVAKAEAEAQVYTNILLYIAPFGGGVATAALRAEVQRYIDARKMVNATVTILNPVYVTINITVDVQVLPRYNQLTVKAQVEKALKFLLSFERVEFGHRVTISDVYRTISSVDGVDYSVVTRVSRTSTGISDVQLSKNEIPDIGDISVSVSGGIVI